MRIDVLLASQPALPCPAIRSGPRNCWPTPHLALGLVGLLAASLPAAAGADETGSKTLARIEVNAGAAGNASPALPERSLEVGADTSEAIDLADLLSQLPGLNAQSRGNHAQDIQLSARGHGTRSSFGIRSLRLYIDGIPASAPDGQGQLSHLPPGFQGQLHVASGPLAAFHGNASGGLLRFVSRPIAADQGGLSLLGGRSTHGLHLHQALATEQGAWRAAAGQIELSGHRPHSAARRDYGSLAWQWRPRSGSSLSQWRVRLDHFDSPYAQDPLGLTLEQLRTDPDGVSPIARLYNTRKQSRQQQLGSQAGFETEQGRWQAAAWTGRRDVLQILAVPPAAQRNPQSGGGVIDLARDFHGLEASWQREWGATALTLGLRWESQLEQRRGFENFVEERLGLRGRLRRDERNRVLSSDPYLLFEWWPAPNWQWATGLRRSRLQYRSDDRYIASGNPDDSGARDFSASVPLLAVGYQTEGFGARLAWARGFEAPTGVELAYRADGLSGFNTELRPASSRLLELGLAWHSAGADPRWRADVALFDERIENELIVLQSSAGRSVYGNAAASRRRGIESSIELALSATLQLRGNATWLDARFRGTDALAGKRLPAVPQRFGRLGLHWTLSEQWSALLDLRGSSGVYANDQNTLKTAGHARWDLQLSRQLCTRFGQLRVTGQLNNLFDRRYVGSVIVNESNGRYFEPASGREASLELGWTW